jgi:hypothetical protein
MTKLLFWLLVLGLFSAAPSTATPLNDQRTLQQHFFTQFPTLSRQDFANGVYALDPDAKQSWLAIEQFPPYEIAIDRGKKTSSPRLKMVNAIRTVSLIINRVSVNTTRTGILKPKRWSP